jgi:hypothetical protein
LSHGGTAEAIAGVGVEGGSAQAILALSYIEFAREQIDLALLVGNFLLPLVVDFLCVRGVRLPAGVFLLRSGSIVVRLGGTAGASLSDVHGNPKGV